MEQGELSTFLLIFFFPLSMHVFSKLPMIFECYSALPNAVLEFKRAKYFVLRSKTRAQCRKFQMTNAIQKKSTILPESVKPRAMHARVNGLLDRGAK